MTRKVRITAIICAIVLAIALPIGARTLTAPMPNSVQLEELTWVEVRELLQHGHTTVIVPTGGTEQNGPHMVLGKHNFIVRYTAEAIARELGNAVVAPVMPYVPEGDIESREGHMAFPGTISLPEDVFEKVLESAARSLRVAGFKTIAFVGEHGGNQKGQEDVAKKLNAEWKGTGVRVIHVGDYYNPIANGQVPWLRAQGEPDWRIGTHAAIRDTSELMAVYPEGIRTDRLALNGGLYGEKTGVIGDPKRASPERGRKLLALKVAAAVKQIKAVLATPAPGS